MKAGTSHLHKRFRLFFFLAWGLSSLWGESYIFDHLTMEDGLLNNGVSGIVQDPRGYLWFGTQNGLNRYDGKNFKIFDSAPFSTNSLPHNQIQTLYLDEDDSCLWIGTYEGLSRMSLYKEEFLNFTSDPKITEHPLSNGIVIAIAKTPDNAVWVGTMDGLNRIDPDTHEVTVFHHSDDEGSLLHSTVRSLLVDSSGRLWVGTYGGLDLFIPEQGAFRHFTAEKGNPLALQSPYVMTLAEDSSGSLWVGTWDGGVSKFDPESGSITEHIPLEDNIYLLSPDEGNLWIGTWGNGLYLRDQDSQISHFPPDTEDRYKLNHGIVYSFLKDRSGLYWIGTNGGGINKLNPHKRDFRFLYHDKSEKSLPEDTVVSMLVDSSGDFWIGTYNNGLWRFPGEGSDSFVHNWMPDEDDPFALSHQNVHTILEDSEGNLWIGSLGGLDQFNRETEDFDHHSLKGLGFDENLEPIIYDMVEDPDGTFWIGTYSSGVIHWTPEEGILKVYSYDKKNPALSNNLVNSLLIDHEGTLWVGTNRGLNRYDRESDQFITYFHDIHNPASLSSNYISTLYEDMFQNLWIGTDGGGLNLLDPVSESFSFLTRQDGLIANQIQSIQEDSRNQLWIGTINGLNILLPGTMEILTIDSSDGIMVPKLDQGAAKDDRYLYFGSRSGVLRFEPTILFDNLVPPVLSMNEIQVMGEPVPDELYLENDNTLVLSWDQNYLNFDFVALDYTAPMKNQYRYKMEGLDKEWVNSGNRSYASYSNLKPGYYTFKIHGSNNDGIWSEEPLTVGIQIRRPPWRQGWFVFVYVFIGVLVFLIFSNFQANILLRRKLREAESRRQNLQVLNSRLEELAWKDSLTGLANRRFFDLSINNLWHLAVREKKHLALLMIDVDFFKNYNDYYGHPMGDEALKSVGQIIRSILRRETDAVCRYGGEEFTVLLFDLTLGDALTLSESLLEKVRQAAIPHIKSEAAPYLTISIGLTGMVPQVDQKPSVLIKAADTALYKAKSHGRNRVEYCNPIDIKEEMDE